MKYLNGDAVRKKTVMCKVKFAYLSLINLRVGK